MSSADPTDVDSPLQPPKVRRSPLRQRWAPGRRTSRRPRKSRDVRSERPQAKPADRKTDRAEPRSIQLRTAARKASRAHFEKHPIAMIVCLGLIVARHHRRHRVVSSCPPLREHGRRLYRRPAGAGQSAGHRQHHQRQCHRQPDRQERRSARDHRSQKLQGRGRSGGGADPAERGDVEKPRCPDRCAEGPDRAGHPAGDAKRTPR